MPYLNVTTRIDETPDQELLSAKGASGFPTLYFMEPETGAVLNDWWWPGDEETVRDMLGQAQAKADGLKKLMAEAEAKPDDKALQAGLQIKLALMYAAAKSMDELAELSKVEGLDPEIKAEFDAWYAARLVQQVMEQSGEIAESREEWMELCSEGFYKLFQDGVRLPADNDQASTYYELTMNHALEVGDSESAKGALAGYEGAMRQILESNPNYKDQIEKMIQAARDKVNDAGSETEES